MHIVHPGIDVDCTEDVQLSPGNRNVEVIVRRWYLSQRTV